MSGSRLDHDSLLRLSLSLCLLNRKSRAFLALLRLLLDIKQLADIRDHMRQLSRHLKLFLVLSQSRLIQPLIRLQPGHLLPVPSHFSLHVPYLLLQLCIRQICHFIHGLNKENKHSVNCQILSSQILWLIKHRFFLDSEFQASSGSCSSFT